MARMGKPFGQDGDAFSNGNIWQFVRVHATLLIAVFLIAFGAIIGAVLSHHDASAYLSSEARDAERYVRDLKVRLLSVSRAIPLSSFIRLANAPGCRMAGSRRTQRIQTGVWLYTTTPRIPIRRSA